LVAIRYYSGARNESYLRGADDLDWTFLSPAAMFAPGAAKFRIGGDQLLVGERGSSISMEDYAIAAVDEAPNICAGGSPWVTRRAALARLNVAGLEPRPAKRGRRVMT
jgi:hypothetical protein